ncbi:MAG: CBS domain-containing protein [Candidatus Heimdallarchaeota archaeon]|nr:CBS domain-containing protein [Candidatus Heimdallarchaeota archaeon]
MTITKQIFNLILFGIEGVKIFPKLAEIKRLREKIGWSQSELAEKVGISQSAIPKYENGKQTPSYEIAVKIFELLLQEDIQIDPEVSEILTSKIVKVTPRSALGEALDIMKEQSISQIPVIKENLVVGTISESLVLELLNRYRNLDSLRDESVENIMGDILPIVPESAKIQEITPLLRRYGAVMVLVQGKLSGIVTKADLLDM